MLADKVLIIELFAVDGFAARALHHDQSTVSSLALKFYIKGFSYAHHVDWRKKACTIQNDAPTLPLVKSPPWSMNPGIIRWNLLPS